MPYNESGVPITTDGYFSPGGYVTRQYLFDTYPQLSDQAKSAGLWTWGYNNSGQLGDNTITNKSSPVQTISGGSNWKLIGGGGYHNSVIKTDGTLWMWGYNANGTLGDNTRTFTSSPIQTISGGTNWSIVSSSGQSVFAIKTDGTLWVWGLNGNFQLGTNNQTSYSSPVQTVSGGTNWKLVSGGGYHTAAIKTDGTLWAWGSNSWGQLGDNTFVDKSSPIQTVSGGTNWKLLGTTSNGTAAIKTDGTLWLWGQNNFGQLGDNTRTSRSSPVQTISSGTNWKQVDGGQQHFAGIKTDGTLWTWGYNPYGAIGDNTTTNKSSPVQTVSGGTNWKQIACGFFHSAATKTDGTLWLWGRNNYAQLGDNTIVDKSSPIQTIAGGTNWKQISSLFNTVSAIKDFNEDF